MGLPSLLFQSLAMGFSSFFMGLVPLMFSSVASGSFALLPPPPPSRPKLTLDSIVSTGKRLKMASTFGMGLLVGAAMVVIIPECVFSLPLATALKGEEAQPSFPPADPSILPYYFSCSQRNIYHLWINRRPPYNLLHQLHPHSASFNVSLARLRNSQSHPRLLPFLVRHLIPHDSRTQERRRPRR